MVEQKMANNHTHDEGRRRNFRYKAGLRQVSLTTSTDTSNSEPDLMEQVVEQSNMQRAWKRVKGNKGCAGSDGLNIAQTAQLLREKWTDIKGSLLAGRYVPQPVRRVEIPKPKGGTRKLGIPTITDRLIQQAIYQVLEPVFDPWFSESSFGFRTGRSTQMAVQQCQRYINKGYRWVVDMDLEKFFDTVNHDILMARVCRKVKDKRLLGIIRRYLQAGVLEGGVISQVVKGTPQGGPLSPLLSNILLDSLDKELEKRGHKFARYADDCVIYVASLKAGKRVMESVKRFVTNVLKQTGVVLTPGNGFGTPGEGYFRISLTVNNDLLEEAVSRISKL